MNNLEYFRHSLKHVPNETNVNSLLEFYGLAPYQAKTTQKLVFADAYLGWAYWSASVAGYGMLYVIPALAIAVFEMSFGQREVVKLPKAWATKLELKAVNELKYK